MANPLLFDNCRSSVLCLNCDFRNGGLLNLAHAVYAGHFYCTISHCVACQHGDNVFIVASLISKKHSYSIIVFSFMEYLHPFQKGVFLS